MFSQHFIECIFHFNSYNKHKLYNKFSQSERYVSCDDYWLFCVLIQNLLWCFREKVRFSLKGPEHRVKRFRIYRFLLENFTDTQRFNITNKINQTVLGEWQGICRAFSGIFFWSFSRKQYLTSLSPSMLCGWGTSSGHRWCWNSRRDFQYIEPEGDEAAGHI